MIQYLQQKKQKWLNGLQHVICIYFEPRSTKPELYDLIKLHKINNSQFKLDALLAAYEHSVLRLPPYHPELNPIEKIWAMVKQWVAARNTTFKLNDVEALTRERFASIGIEEWASVCKHVNKVVEEYLKAEYLLDDISDKFVFTVNTGESSSNEVFDSEEDEDDDSRVAAHDENDEETNTL